MENLSKSFTPSPTSLEGRQTISQLTMHFAPVVVSFAGHKKARWSLLMNLIVSDGMTSGVM
jgi:hypothetical protein